ncbi:MAG: ATP-binding protein [Betaproteobacteria bacterium]|nr:ATP-binding protein [Betaproteobacteria bacterium]
MTDQTLKNSSPPGDALSAFLHRAEEVLARFERLLPEAPQALDWESTRAFRWRRRGTYAGLQAVPELPRIRMSDLHDIDSQKARVDANTRQFLASRPANNVLLTGARGCGKSSLVKALLNEYAGQGLRLVEIDRDDLADLPDLVEGLAKRPERFIVFCDDLSFETGDATYKALKVALDGSIAAPPDNVLIYATSNRRHLMPEYFSENLETHRVGDEIHPGETIEEKISLSERFGLWVSFYPFSQEEYLNIVIHWLHHFGVATGVENRETLEREALNWALQRGSRSGRIAWQFARDWAGNEERG